MRSLRGLPRTSYAPPPAPAMAPFDHVWYWRSRLPERKGEHCRVLARGRMNTILVEFPDGYRVTTSRHAVRKAHD